MPRIAFSQGERHRPLTVTCQGADGTLQDLTGSAVTLSLVDVDSGAAIVANLPMTLRSQLTEQGRAFVYLPDAFFDRPVGALARGKVRVTLPDGVTVLKWPTEGALEIELTSA